MFAPPELQADRCHRKQQWHSLRMILFETGLLSDCEHLS